MTHEDVRELIPAYALNAVGSMERLELEEHLDSCDSCRRILNEHLEAAGLFGFTAEPKVPSNGLKQRVMAEVSSSDGEVTPASAGRRLAPAPRGRIAVVAVVAVVVALAWLLIPRGNGSASLTSEVTRMLASKDLVTTPLLPTREIPGASGQVFDPMTGDSVALIVRGLRDPKGGFYMLWVFVGETIAPLGQMAVSDDGTSVVVVKRVPEEHEGFLVTIETDQETKTPGETIILRST